MPAAMKAAVRQSHPAAEFLTHEGCWILEVANDGDDEAVSIARARVPAAGTTEWHRLDGIEERYIIVSGRGRAEVGDLDPTDVGPGDVVRIPANTWQRITNTEQADLIFYCVCTPRFRADAYVRGRGETPG